MVWTGVRFRRGLWLSFGVLELVVGDTDGELWCGEGVVS